MNSIDGYGTNQLLNHKISIYSHNMSNICILRKVMDKLVLYSIRVMITTKLN